MRKTTCLLLGASLMSLPVFAQQKDSLKGGEVPGLLDRAVDIVSSEAKDVYESGKRYTERKYLEAGLENDIENRIVYQIPDKEIEEFFDYLGLEQGIEADVISVSDTTITAVVSFLYDFDNTKIHKQYEFSRSGETIDKILDEGKTWGETAGRELSYADFAKVMKLDKAIVEGWDMQKHWFEQENHEKTFVYERYSKVFQNIDRNVDDWMVFDDELTRAYVGVRHYVLDKFGNIDESRVYYVIEEYKLHKSIWLLSGVVYEGTRRQAVLEKDENDYVGKARKQLVKGLKYLEGIIQQ